MIDTNTSTTAALGFTALALMGAFLSRHRLFCPEVQQVEEDETEERSAPPTPARACKSRLVFGDPIQHLSPIPTLGETPRWERERVYWQAHEYAQIRDNQRRLIETVLRSARRCAEGELPPPIPGESRRGLGLICEPGTNSGRAARVRSARRAVVEAQRDGYSPAQLADLAAELGAWATNNAREMGLKDAEAVGDFDFKSFSREIQSQEAQAPAAATPPTPRRTLSPAASPPSPVAPIARAARASAKKEGVAHARRSVDGSAPAPSTTAYPEPDEDDSTTHADGLGLASMIRNDSLTNLVEHGAEEEPATAPDGAGLASMIRNDSLGDLTAWTALAPAPDSVQEPAK
jgi:hypothetical protein